jgi:hypothetical protein
MLTPSIVPRMIRSTGGREGGKRRRKKTSEE